MPQFYLPGPWDSQKPNTLTPEVAHHLRVRRVQIGETFPVFDGNGLIGEATLLSLSGKTGQAELNRVRVDTHRETPYAITLAQGLAGGDKMDWIVEKAVETGAQIIAPLQCERSVIKLTRANDQERAQKRLTHWLGIIQSTATGSTNYPLQRVAMVTSPGMLYFTGSNNNSYLEYGNSANIASSNYCLGFGSYSATSNMTAAFPLSAITSISSNASMYFALDGHTK